MIDTHPALIRSRIIGWGRRGPVWSVAGGSVDAGQAGGTGAGADTGGSAGGGAADGGQGDQGGNGGAGQAAPPAGAADSGAAGGGAGQGGSGTGNAGAGGGDQGSGQDVNALPQWARDSLTKANSQAASQRTQLTQVQQQQQAMLDAVKSALGLGDKTPTPEELTKALSEERGRSRQAMVDLAVYQNAGKHAADPTALLDSRSFAQAVASIDQNAPDFATQLDAAIKVAVEHNPKLKAAAAQAAAASGTDGTGGTGTEGDSGSGDTSVAAFRKPIRRRAGLTD